MEAPSVSDVMLLGTASQIAVSALLTVLLYWASRQAGRRPYFRCWWFAFLALTVSLAALPVRYAVLRAAERGPEAGVFTHWPTDLVYQGGKLLFFGLLLSGAIRYARRSVPGWVGWVALGGTLGYAVASVVLSTTIGGLVAWQALVAVPVLIGSAYLLVTASAGRGSVGTVVTAAAMVVLAGVWGLYFWIFVAEDPAGVAKLTTVLMGSTFLDALLHLLLGLGMVVVLVEDTLREASASDARMARLLHGTSDAIVSLDDRGAIGLSNAAAEALFGTGPLVGRDARTLVSPEDVDLLQEVLSAGPLAEPGAPTRIRVRGQRTGGQTFALELTAARGAGKDRTLLHARDVTEEAEREASRQALSARLARSQKMEAVGRLVSGVAHELNNPLAAILLTAEEALEQERLAEARPTLTAVRDQVRRARAVVADLATLARGREGRRRLVTPDEILTPILGALERELRRQGAALDVSGLTPCRGKVDCDPAGLQQVITNLVLNAGTAAGPGGRVFLRSGSDHRSCWVEVVDDGPGIPEHVLPRIWDPFFTTRPQGQGTGLGLSVAQAIVAQHRGTIEAENLRPPARGARFVVTLALAEPEPATPAAPAPEPSSAPAAAAPTPADGVGAFPRGDGTGGPRTVLVVDDEAAVRESLRRVFARHGWVVDSAEDGAAALRRLDGGPAPSMIVCDLKMPVMSGIELHDRIAADRPALLGRMIFITGDTASPDAAAFVARTECPVLDKPFDLLHLGRTVAERIRI